MIEESIQLAKSIFGSNACLEPDVDHPKAIEEYFTSYRQPENQDYYSCNYYNIVLEQLRETKEKLAKVARAREKAEEIGQVKRQGLLGQKMTISKGGKPSNSKAAGSKTKAASKKKEEEAGPKTYVYRSPTITTCATTTTSTTTTAAASITTQQDDKVSNVTAPTVGASSTVKVENPPTP